MQLRYITCSPCLHSVVKTEANVWENPKKPDRIIENPRRMVEGFHLLENSHKLCRGKARRTCFIYFIKLLFSVLTKKKTIYEIRIHVYFNFFHKTVSSHNMETEQTILHVIFVLHSAMKTHLWTNQIARTIQIIL